MRRFRSLPLVLLVSLAGVAACARGVTLNTDPGEAYSINVINGMPHPMVIYFDDGSGRRLLGTVAGNRSERFVVAGSASPTVTVVAHDEARTHEARRTVTLRAGETVNVRIE